MRVGGGIGDVRGWLTGLIATFAPALASAAGSKSCPLPLDVQVKSYLAFTPIHEFVMNEPRCVNCHGGVNPHVDTPGPDPDDPTEHPSTVMHGPGAIDRFMPLNQIEVSCDGCHEDMPRRRDGSASRWFTAAGFHAFLDKDQVQLCKQFKGSTGTAEEFMGHIDDDNGGNQFIRTAFAGNRGIPGLAPIPPRISHASFMRMGREWIEALGGQFKGESDCGCEPRIKGKFTQRDEGSMDSITISGDLEWKLDLSKGAPAPGAPLVFKPSDGSITLHLKSRYPGVASHCDADGRKTFQVRSLSRGALRLMKLEIEDDGDYKLMLVIPDSPDPFPTWTFAGECIWPNITNPSPMTVKFQSVILGKREGTVDGPRGIHGKVEPAMRRGTRTITGEWSFATQGQ
jgi:hypothetical protein